MSCILPEPGYVTVSIDLSAGEPTVTAHFSQDPRYRYASFDGVGKAPYYDGSVLMISDIYLMAMSISPIGSVRMMELFHSEFGGVPFAEQWLIDADVCKAPIKKERDFHKMACLGWGYGMGPKKFVKQAYDKGYSISLKDSSGFHKAYWRLFAGVRTFADKLAKAVELRGYIVNPFGYRLTPPPHKAYNYYIQSSVSGIMHVFCAKLFTIAPYAVFRAVIHDEVVADVPEDRIEDFRRARDLATDSLNEDLGWSVAVRTGYVTGKTWYEAK